MDIHLLLVREGRILLGLRRNTGYLDEHWHLPAGHLEENESALTALAREAKEEIGADIDRNECELAFVLHQKSGGSRVGLFFRATEWGGTATNNEPDKCAEVRWFDLNDLPSNMVPYAAFVLAEVRKGKLYGEYNW